MKKLVLFMIDSLKPEMLERAIAEDKAPMLAEIVRRGTRVPDGVSVFPSVTPAASASITTGRPVDAHGIPSINWYHRGERRYVEYGSSWPATRTFGVLRTINDIVYNMNFEHLSRAHPTFFETLDDTGVRTACTPFLIFRGRTRHELAVQGWMRRVARAANFHHAVYGPSELFYGELFSSREVECRPTLARPGTRDAYSGCVGEYLARYELYDFLLFSLPDNDHYSHRNGPDATVTSIEWADANIARLMKGAGGMNRFFEKHAVIVMADHAQTTVKHGVVLADALARWRVLRPGDPDPASAELAVSPGGRSAMVYLLGDEERRAGLIGEVVEEAKTVGGVDLIAWKEGGEACIWSDHGELRFAPGSQVSDRRGASWDLMGSLEAIDGELNGGELVTSSYPDALGRVWAALGCDSTGEILISAEQEYEFVDWGGADHAGGGSHGSLGAGDSSVPLVFLECGPDLAPESGDEVRPEWSIADVSAVVLDHFGVSSQHAPEEPGGPWPRRSG